LPGKLLLRNTGKSVLCILADAGLV
jgi:hypothetical protein